jgi:hypothetical protein
VDKLKEIDEPIIENGQQMYKLNSENSVVLKTNYNDIIENNIN